MYRFQPPWMGPPCSYGVVCGVLWMWRGAPYIYIYIYIYIYTYMLQPPHPPLLLVCCDVVCGAMLKPPPRDGSPKRL